MKNTGFVFQLFRLYLLPWAVGTAVWFAVVLVIGVIHEANRGAEDVATAVNVAWVGVLFGPALTAAAAVLVLPRSARGRFGHALVAGVPVILTIMIWRLLTVQAQIGFAPISIGASAMVLIAGLVSSLLVLIFRAQSNRARQLEHSDSTVTTPSYP